MSTQNNNNNNNNNDDNHRWIGKSVTISGIGGSVRVDTDGTQVRTGHGKASPFVVEAARDGKIAFRVGGTGSYLTLEMYGDEQRQSVLQSLARHAPATLLPEHMRLIVEYVVDRSTSDDNFEGAGYNYAPMTARPGPPNVLQMFDLEHGNGMRSRNSYGIRSLFGTYWRSQHWQKTVSQSPVLLADETFYFSAIDTQKQTA